MIYKTSKVEVGFPDQPVEYGWKHTKAGQFIKTYFGL